MPTPLAKVIAFAAGLGVLFGAASLLGPQGSSATTVSMPPPASNQADESVRTVKMPALIGTLTGSDYAVDVYMGRKGAQYTVRSLDGKTLADSLTSEELYARFPELDVNAMHAEGDADTGDASDIE